MNVRDEQRARSHETILASAARLLREKGISGARVADVMRGAGLTVGGFYAHFASKESLIDDALRMTARDLRARLFARLDEKPEADRVEVILKRYLSAAHRDNFVTGCPLPAVVGEVGTTAQEHAPVLGEQLEAMTDALESHLGTETRTGTRTLPRRYVALGLVALMVGGLSLSRALRGTAMSDDVLKACRALGARAVRDETKL